jgi:hypothetical protein
LNQEAAAIRQRLEEAFRRVQAERMQDMPLLHRALPLRRLALLPLHRSDAGLQPGHSYAHSGGVSRVRCPRRCGSLLLHLGPQVGQCLLSLRQAASQRRCLRCSAALPR